MKAGVINVELRLDKGQYDVSIKSAGEQLKSYQGQLSQTSQRVKDVEHSHQTAGEMLRKFVLLTASVKFAMRDLNETLFALPIAALKASGDIERMTFLMKGLSKETTEAGKAAEAASNVKFVFDLAKNAPFQVGALTDAFVKLKSAGLDPTNGLLINLTNSVARFGGDSETLKRASVAIQQMAGKGVISMEELRQQLGEAIPDAMAMMAEGAGMSMAEFTKKVSTGTVEAKSAIENMNTVMEMRNSGAAKALMGTWVGMLEQLKTQWTLALNVIGTSGLSDSAKVGIKELTDMLKSPEFLKFAKEIGSAFGNLVGDLSSVIKSVIKFRTEIKEAALIITTLLVSSKLAAIYDRLALSAKNFYAQVQGQIANYKLSKENEAAYVIALAAKEAAITSQQYTNERLLIAETALFKITKESEVALLQKQNDIERKLAIKSQSLDDELRYAKLVSQAVIANAAINGMSRRDLAAFKRNEAEKLIAFEVSINRRLASSVRVHAKNMTLLTEEAAKAVAAAETRIAAERQLNTQALATLASTERQVVSLEAMGAAGSRAGLLLGGLGTVLRGLLTPLNLIFVAIEAGMYMWEAYGREAKLAGERAKASKDAEKGMASEDDVKASRVKLKSNDDRTKQIDKDLAKSDFDLVSESAGYDERTDAANSKLMARAAGKARASLLLERVQIQKDSAIENKTLSDQLTIVEKSDREQAISANRDRRSESIAAAKTSSLLRYQTLSEEIKNLETDSTTSKEKTAYIAKKKDDLRKNVLETQKIEIDNIEKFKTETLKNQERLVAKSKTKAGLSAQDKLDLAVSIAEVQDENDAIDAANEKYKSKAKIFGTSPEYAKTNPNSGASAKGIAKEQESWIDKTTKEIATLKAKFPLLKKEIVDYKKYEEEALAELDQVLGAGGFDVKVKKIVKTKKGTKTVTDSIRPDKIPAGALLLQEQKLAYIQEAADYKKALSSALSDVNSADDFFENARTTSESKAKTTEDPNVPQQVAQFRSQLALERQKIEKAIDVIKKGENKLDELAKANATKNNLYDDSKVGATEANLYAEDTNKYLATLELKTEKLQTSYLTQEQLRERDYQLEVQDVTKRIQLEKLSGAEFVKAQERQDKILEKMAQEHQFKTQTPLQNLTDSWKSATERMQQASTSWSNQTIDAIMNFTKTGKLEFGKLAESILSDILRIRLEQQIGGVVNGIIDGAVSTIGGAFDNAGGGDAGGGIINSIKSVFGFANGGVMSGFGEVPMNYYSKGGVANTPQVAVFGEGRMNEAYVPLPDGRSIPVTLQGGQQSGGGNNVTVNVVNQTSQQVSAKKSEPRFDGKQMILDIVLTAAAQPGQFREGMKGALG